VAPVLNTLYSGVTAMVLRASGHLDAALMNQAAALLAPVRDSWAINAKISPTP
jgi:hypothetical protein